MLNDLIKICKILPYTSEDVDYIHAHYGKFALDIIMPEELENYNNVPTLIIGWKNVKEIFPEQSIRESKIFDNLFWTYSISENEIKLKSDINSFLEFSIRKFFSKPIITYDAILDGEIRDFLKNLSKYILFPESQDVILSFLVCLLQEFSSSLVISLLSLIIFINNGMFLCISLFKNISLKSLGSI